MKTPKITKAVISCNQVVIQTLMFYLLDQDEKHNELPTINVDLIRNCVIILCKKLDVEDIQPKKRKSPVKNSSYFTQRILNHLFKMKILRIFQNIFVRYIRIKNNIQFLVHGLLHR